MRKKDKVEEIVENIKEGIDNPEPRKKPSIYTSEDLVPTGSTLLNLALSDNPDGGYRLGTMVNIIGGPSSGKCIRDCYVLSPKLGMIKIDDIKMPDVGMYPIDMEFAGPNNKTVSANIFYSEYTDRTIKIETEYGFEIEGTPEHPIAIWDNGEILIKKLENVKEGDNPIIQIGSNIFANTPYRFSNQEISEYKASKFATNIFDFEPPTEMTKELAYILGVMVADGSILNTSLCITNSKKAIKTKLFNCLNELGLSFKVNGKNICIGGVRFTNFIRNILDNPETYTARYKYVPRCILSSTKEHQSIFLRGLIDCDGYFSGNELEYSTASAELARQVQLMLLNFGILSKKSPKYVNGYDHTYYALLIYASDIMTYADVIGADRLKVSAYKTKRGGQFRSFTGLNSKMLDDINLVRRKIGWKKNGSSKYGRVKSFHIPTSDCTISQLDIKNFINSFEDFSNLFDIEFYKNLLNITTSKIIKKDEKDNDVIVYDFTIPDGHLFWSNGFISHNSLMALTMYAELVNDKRFDNYELIYDETEAAMFFDLSAFGEKINRIRFDIRSRTIQDWSQNLMGLFNLGKKDKRKKDEGLQSIIHVTDSFDALSTDSDLEDMRPKKGGFRVEKPLVASATFPKLCQAMEASKSLLFIISQTRSSLAMFGNPESRSGGRAIDFYESHEVWLRKSTPIKKEIKRSEKDFVIGNKILLDVKKNKLVGKRRSVEIDVLDNYGIDDIGSCIDWLNKYGFWGIDKKVIDTCGDLELPKAKREELVKIIEEQNMEKDFRKIVAECWHEVEEELKLDRKRKYI